MPYFSVSWNSGIYCWFDSVNFPSTGDVHDCSTLLVVTDDVCMGFFATAANILLTANGDVKVSFPLLIGFSLQNDAKNIYARVNCGSLPDPSVAHIYNCSSIPLLV